MPSHSQLLVFFWSSKRGDSGSSGAASIPTNCAQMSCTMSRSWSCIPIYPVCILFDHVLLDDSSRHICIASFPLILLKKRMFCIHPYISIHRNTQCAAEMRIPSPASTRPLNMLPKEANGMREGASKLLPMRDSNII